MTIKAFQIYNMIVLIILLFLNFFVLFAFGIGESKLTITDWFPIILSFILWGIFYFIQFTRSNTIWRVFWFGIMVVVLYFWETGLGAAIGTMIRV
ncbi:hypothetical protein DS745_04035 [Anaerobacillus alkaliphilus]|uniref:Uncharacterized protein n=1 Tax=Anaerobacillus alkaliphilus TaxID=1548597 RepID=A0A4Q0VYW3_9BACI|nr:hypothetical protein [Anaerobacillus alkaliphilus]RXJ04562.1 hypothetical protein DS745_04035 [Anaerobacillus alkaliphilus]